MLGAKAGDDAEANEHDDPRIAFVLVHQVVTEGPDNECRQPEDQDGDGFGEVAVANIVQDIRAGNGIDHGPSNADDNVEDCHEFGGPPPCTRQQQLAMSLAAMFGMDRPTEREALNSHGPKAQLRSERRHECRRKGADNIEEEQTKE